MGSFTPPPTIALAPGDQLDRYELLCVLAQGGMGTVWLARMTGKLGFERLVALKTILPTYSNDRGFCDMFLDEAKIAAQVDHENVARIIEIGEDKGLLYYAMELIDGESLRKLFRDIRAAGAEFPMGVALRIAADACAGLHAVHELRGPDNQPLNVVHRDVSPQNLLISIRGTTKLIDFGVAKASERRTEETAAGTLKGKLEYMAPEQALGEGIDRRADVYAIGAVLYELLVGKPVRNTDEGRQLAALHEVMTGVPFEPMPPHIPSLVRAVVERALSRERGNRYRSCEELRHALEQVMLATGQGATTDDVAAVLAHYGRERTAKRKDAIEQALRAAAEGRLNAQTIIAPVSHFQQQQSAAQQQQQSPSFQMQVHTQAMQRPDFPPSQQMPVAYPRPTSPVMPIPTQPGDGPVTGPSMRTMQGATYNTKSDERKGGSAAKVFGAMVVLVLVAVLGAVAGVVATRRGLTPTIAAAAPEATTVAPTVTPDPVPVPPPVPTEATAPTGVVIGASPVADAGPSANATGTTTAPSSTPTSTSHKKDAGSSPRRPHNPHSSGGAKPNPNDEYGF